MSPEQPRADPELTPHQLPTNTKYGIKAIIPAVTDTHLGQSREDALAQVEKGWLNAPFPSDETAELVTGDGSQLVNPAFRFGAQQGKN